jgi:hypothetical protein
MYWILYIISPLVASSIEAGYSFAALREVAGKLAIDKSFASAGICNGAVQ